jgi:hypothetical protein
MPIINYASKEIQFKIVYYGPALSGKTTTIAYIHSRLPAAFRGDLVSLATAADRTLFFDFLPVDAMGVTQRRRHRICSRFALGQNPRRCGEFSQS